jgi:hypothetical protein
MSVKKEKTETEKEKYKKYKEKCENTLPDGSVIDFNKFDWGEFSDMRIRQKIMAFWFTCPNQTGYMNYTKAALKAGYPRVTAYKARFNIGTNEQWKKLTEMLSSRFTKVALEEAYAKALNMKILRANYNVKDFYETVTDEETMATRIVARDINSIPEDKAILIDNVSVNQAGIATYDLPKRDKEINDIIRLRNETADGGKQAGDYDVETTVETIKDNLRTIKTTVRLMNENVRNNAENYMENDENQPEFD